MYSKFFGLKDSPFSIAPDPRYLYMSERHREGLAHLLYGVSGHGGFVLLTGEVGTGKTTVCRCFLQQVPDNTDIAFIIHPKLTGRELLASICDELRIPYSKGASTKVLVDLINQHLLNAHANNRNTVVIIDEAQNLSIEVLEQLRLLTNLETSEKKLLQIVLLGQPELVDLLQRPELRQLSQRITARYHLQSLTRDDVRAYVYYRLSVAGLKREIFTPAAMTALYKLSQGVPRLINLICDRAMLGAYARHSEVIDKKLLKRAAKEVVGDTRRKQSLFQSDWLIKGALSGAVAGLVMLAMLTLWSHRPTPPLAEALGQERKATPVTEATESAEKSGVAVVPPPKERASADPDPDLAAVSADPDMNEVFQSAMEKIPPDSLVSAYQNLFKRWGVEYDPARQPSPCDFAETRKLRCLHRQGNWRSLITLDRPVILKLQSTAGEEFYVTVQQILDDEVARIDLAEQSLTVKVAALDALWSGEYSLVWNLPPYSSAVIRASGTRQEQDWLAERLTRIEAMQSGTRLAPDQGVVLRADAGSLEDRIRRFQASMGLLPDGIAGALTLIQMSSFLDPDVPRLNVEQSSAQLGGQN